MFIYSSVSPPHFNGIKILQYNSPIYEWGFFFFFFPFFQFCQVGGLGIE
jgi:hypothetical protein